MILKLISPEKVHFDGEVDSVNVPDTDETNFVILKGFAPLISTLGKGKVSYNVNGNVSSLEISSGFLDVCNDVVVVCVEL